MSESEADEPTFDYLVSYQAQVAYGRVATGHIEIYRADRWTSGETVKVTDFISETTGLPSVVVLNVFPLN